MEQEQSNVTSLDAPNKRSSLNLWKNEISAAKKRLRKYHERATKVVERFLGEHVTEGSESFSVNLFYSNTKTLQDMLYSNLPKIEVNRTFADSADDVGRVAGTMIERALNLDIANNGEEYDAVLRSCLQDRLLPGLGVAKVRYEFESEEVLEPAVHDSMGGIITPETSVERVISEAAPCEYWHWQDVLWGWGRSFSTLPWIAYRTYMTEQQAADRFGAQKAKMLEYRKRKVAVSADVESDTDMAEPSQKAEVWEIWDRISRTVYWFGEGSPLLLDEKEDPLHLSGFFPSPPFLIANATTSLYQPCPDYILAQDLYTALDRLQTRIDKITDAVKVVGVYDASCEGIKRMLTEGVENDLIPVEEWAMFAESGGLKGKIDWLPLKDVADTLGKLQQLRDDTIRLLQQVTGHSDVMQGQLDSPYEGVQQSKMKAAFGSIRVQALQDAFARFASDLMQLKAEVICKHFEPQTIVTQSNMEFSFDRELIGPAVQLLKQPDMANIRVVVRPESVAMIDYAQLKVERTEFLNALSTFMQSAAPMLETQPNAMPYLLKLLQWTLSGFKGSKEIESVLDRAIDGAMQEAKSKQGQPNAEQQRAQAEIQKIEAKKQADLSLRQADAQADLQQSIAVHQAKMGEIAATHEGRMKELMAKLQSDLLRIKVDTQHEIAQTNASASAESKKDAYQTQLKLIEEAEKVALKLEGEAGKSMLKINEIREQSVAKMRELQKARLDEPKETGEDE